jgi:predicted transcriptional regulator
MELDSYIERVQADLRATAALGNEELGRAVEHLASALESSLRVAMIEALSGGAAELSSEIAPHVVAVQIDSGEPRLVANLDMETDERAPQPVPAGDDADSGEMARFSLRMGATLKRRVDEAAHSEGVSTNTWIARALTTAVDGPHSRGSHSGRGRVTGWAY